MLACYLDDSGTHGDSKMMVWGGLIGYVDYFDQLDSLWKAALADPCDGRKPPLRAFHSSHLALRRGEFESYSDAERDRTRYIFREAIIDSTVSAISYAVSIDDWDRILTGRVRQFAGTPERWISAFAVKHGCDLARELSMPISFQFDQERKSGEVETLIRMAAEDAPDIALNVGFSHVASVPCLQAADMVAHQTYQHLLRTRADPSASPDPHMRRLMEDAHNWGVVLLQTEGMVDLVNEIGPTLKEYDEVLKMVMASGGFS